MTYDDRQKFEHELINRRIQWLLSSQSIFLAISAFVQKSNFLSILIAVLGISMASLTFLGVYLGIRGKRKSYEEEIAKREAAKQAGKQCEYENDQWGVDTKITERIMFADMLIPVVFFLAWLSILVWRAWLYTSSDS